MTRVLGRVPDEPGSARLWLARGLIGAVFAWNIQCAVAFLAAPAAHRAGFELQGPVGEAMVRALGVLFLMWNVPYAVALWHPLRNCTALREALAMQAIGLAGELSILWSLPAAIVAARSTIARFVAFDGAGLALLAAALWLVRPRQARPSSVT